MFFSQDCMKRICTAEILFNSAVKNPYFIFVKYRFTLLLRLYMPLAQVREEVIRAIKQEVKRRGLSIRMIVDFSDLSYAQIQKILAEDHPNVSLDSLLTLCEALKIPYGLYIQDKKS